MISFYAEKSGVIINFSNEHERSSVFDFIEKAFPEAIEGKFQGDIKYTQDDIDNAYDKGYEDGLYISNPNEYSDGYEEGYEKGEIDFKEYLLKIANEKEREILNNVLERA